MKIFNRRDFIKTTGVAAGGLVLSSSLLQAQGKKAGDKLNIALVGIGAEGEVLLNSLLKLPNLNFVAVCDIWPIRKNYAFRRIFKELKQKAKMYEDYKEVIANHAKELDAVIIATPDFWHAPMTVDFLNAGVNVYCEKMMSDTIEGAKSMVRAARKSGKLLQIGHQRTSNPRYIYARETLLRKNNICGKILASNGQWNRAVTADLTYAAKQAIPADVLKKFGYTSMEQFRNWRWFKNLGGGPLSDLGAHQIDIFGWFLGAHPTRVYASANSDYNHKDWPDNVMCLFDFDKTFQDVKAQVFYQVLTTTSSGGGYYESFMGDMGTLKMSENPAITKLFRENNAPDWEPLIKNGVIGTSEAPAESKVADTRETKALVSYAFPAKIPGYDADKPIHMYHLENFLGAVRGENKLNCDSEHAFAAEAAVFKARESATKGVPLTFAESDFVVEG